MLSPIRAGKRRSNDALIRGELKAFNSLDRLAPRGTVMVLMAV